MGAGNIWNRIMRHEEDPLPPDPFGGPLWSDQHRSSDATETAQTAAPHPGIITQVGGASGGLL